MNDAVISNEKTKISSFAYALVICLHFNNYALNAIFGIGGMTINIGILSAIVFCAFLTTKKHKISLRWFCVLCLLIGYFILSSDTNLEAVAFVSYVALPAVLATFERNTEKVLRYVTYFSLLLCILAPKIIHDLTNIHSANVDDAVSIMGLSYSILPIVVAGIMHRIYYKELNNFVLNCCFLIDIIYLFVLVIYSNRGAVLSLMIFMAFLYIKKPSEHKHDKYMTLKIVLILLLSFLIASYLFEILAVIMALIEKLGLKLAFLEKLMRLNKAADISNGRDVITEYVIANILQSPIIGHGIATITHNSHGVIDYPHNFILQLLYDGGIIMFIPIIWPITKAIKYSFYGKNFNYSILMMFFIVICIPKMLFSMNMWTTPAFWLFIFSCLNYAYKNPKEEESDEK